MVIPPEKIYEPFALRLKALAFLISAYIYQKSIFFKAASYKIILFHSFSHMTMDFVFPPYLSRRFRSIKVTDDAGGLPSLWVAEPSLRWRMDRAAIRKIPRWQ
jgi:hypothetical protein